MVQRDGCRVLIVDDNEDNAESLSMLVEVMGHTVATARDGLEAIDAAERFRPDVILLDIGLPKLDGYEVARRLRAKEEGRHAFLVALTGWARDGEKERAIAAGIDEHLVKPVDPGVLETVIASACSRR